jgi:hypothetical protein
VSAQVHQHVPLFFSNDIAQLESRVWASGHMFCWFVNAIALLIET